MSRRVHRNRVSRANERSRIVVVADVWLTRVQQLRCRTQHFRLESLRITWQRRHHTDGGRVWMHRARSSMHGPRGGPAARVGAHANLKGTHMFVSLHHACVRCGQAERSDYVTVIPRFARRLHR